MASLATFSLDRHVFEHERSLQIAMALEADRVLSGFGTQRTVEERPVGVVAIRAADQALVDAMTERFVKIRGFFGVALITE